MYLEVYRVHPCALYPCNIGLLAKIASAVFACALAYARTRVCVSVHACACVCVCVRVCMCVYVCACVLSVNTCFV